MIFAMTNAVQDRIKRDSRGGSPRSSSILTRGEAKEEAFSLLLQQSETLSDSPVHRYEDWIETEDGLRQPFYTIRPTSSESLSFPELDLFFVHIRKEEGRNFLYFAHKPTSLTIAFQLGSHKLNDGRNSLLEIFYAGMRRLGYSADALLAYFTHSPLSAFTTSGDASSRSWMNSILREYYYQTPPEPVGKRLLERSNFLYNEKRTIFFRDKICWSRTPVELFNETFFQITGFKAIRSIPGLCIQVRLLDPARAVQAECGVFDKKDTKFTKERLPWRRFKIPRIASFKELSEVMMACFGLLNYHWTKYVIRPAASSLANELMILESQDIEQSIEMEKLIRKDQAEELIPTFFDQDKTGISLLWERRDMKQYWQYDFGDNFWFEIESLEEDEMDYYAVEYLDGGGDAPPTDVGGYSGFADFQEALKNPADDENAFYIRWAVEVVYWHPYDEEVIRRYLDQVNPLYWDSSYSFSSWAASRDTDKILGALNVPPGNN